jgi:hypothetical protein
VASNVGVEVEMGGWEGDAGLDFKIVAGVVEGE